jgi:hypothetical protein
MPLQFGGVFFLALFLPDNFQAHEKNFASILAVANDGNGTKKQ